MDQIHWFPTKTHSEDITTSANLTGMEWKIEYVPETVQWGLVPDTVRKHRRQRTRWTAGLVYSISAYWSDRKKGDTTLRRRLGATIVSMTFVSMNVIIAFSAVAIPWILSTGSQTVFYRSPRQLQILLHLESLSFVATFLCGFTRSRSTRNHGSIIHEWQRVGLAPFQAAAIIRLTITELFGIKLQSFAPSSRSTSTNRPTWFGSLTHKIDVDRLAYLLMFSAQLAGGYAGLRAMMTAAEDESLIRCLFSRAGYPAFFLLWVKFVLQSGMPLPRLISSRSIWPLRESMLVRDPVSKVAYPSKEATNPHRTRIRQTFARIAFCYHCIVLVSAWFIR